MKGTGTIAISKQDSEFSIKERHAYRLCQKKHSNTSVLVSGKGESGTQGTEATNRVRLNKDRRAPSMEQAAQSKGSNCNRLGQWQRP